MNDEDRPALLEAVAANPYCPAPLLEALAGVDDDAWVRVAVAGNRAADPELLDRLAADPDDSVRQVVAANPTVDPERLLELAHDESAGVRVSALANPVCPGELLDERAGSADPDERAAVAGNLASPPVLLGRLAADHYRAVRQVALMHVGTPHWALQVTTSLTCNLMIAGNPATPDTVLRRLSDDPYTDVRLAVTRNRQVAPSTLKVLAQDPDALVRAGALRHPRCLLGPVADAAASDDPAMRAAAAANPGCPHHLVAELAGDPDPAVRAALARSVGDAVPVVAPHLVDHLEPLVRVSLAANRAVGGRWLDRLVEDGAVEVRVAAAGNRNLLPPAMAILADDDSPLVRRFLARSVLLPSDIRDGMVLDADFQVVATVARWAPDTRLLWELVDDVVEVEVES